MRNETTLEALIHALQNNYGDVLSACRTVGVSLIFVNQWRKDDKEVNERITEASNVGTQGLVSHAIQRATGQLKEPVFFKGVHTADKPMYSDTLLTTLLKAKIPEFHKDSEGGGGTNVVVNVANIMPRAERYDQWLVMRADTMEYMRQQEALKALPPPPPGPGPMSIEDAVFVDAPFAGITL